MLKICGDTIWVPLEKIFKQALLTGVFPSEWRKGNIIPIHKKGDKQIIKNSWPVSLLPICGKIFERLIFNEMFIYFSANKLTSKNQPVSNPVIPVSTNCYQLPTKFLHLLIMDVRSVFLDISKAFDKVWHEGLIFKLKENGISGELLHILSDFLGNRKKRVVLNGQNSSWSNVRAGVPQGYILGPLFLIYQIIWQAMRKFVLMIHHYFQLFMM